MRLWNFVLGLFALSSLAVVAVAHPRTYVNATGDLLVLCDDLGLGIGGVCYHSGHVTPPSATLIISDNLLSPTSGFYCQNLEENGLCGNIILPGALVAGQTFCGQVSLAAGVNWEPALAVFVFADGPIFGSPLFSACGTLSMGVIGVVDHS